MSVFRMAVATTYHAAQSPVAAIKPRCQVMRSEQIHSAICEAPGQSRANAPPSKSIIMNPIPGPGGYPHLFHSALALFCAMHNVSTLQLLLKSLAS